MANNRQMDERSIRVLGSNLRHRLQGRVPQYILDMLSDSELVTKYHDHQRQQTEWLASAANRQQGTVFQVVR